jgi:hypothetical protein
MSVESQEPRIQRDLDEALRRGGVERLPAGWPRQSRSRGRGGLGIDPRPSSPVQVMVAGAALLLARWLGVFAMLQLGFLAGPLGTLGLIVLGIGILTWLIRPPRREMYWRGRRLELEPDRSWQARLYRLLYRS